MGVNPGEPSVGVCIPVFNDWESARVLVGRLSELAGRLPYRVEVMLVDDGSTEPAPEVLDVATPHLQRVSILALRRNVGHQRAIAVGLTYLYVHGQHDLVCVMDGDGEDDPDHVEMLLARSREVGRSRTVFAKRTKRLERAFFRFGYIAFKIVHLLLTGRPVEVGNFSVVPRAMLERLVAVSEMWNHYAAAVAHAKIPIETVPLPRAPRIAGQSKMNLISLVTHGLGAISVLGDVIGVRLLIWTVGVAALVLLGMAGVAVASNFVQLAVPGWAASSLGWLLVTLLNLTLISMGLALFVLHSRSYNAVIPLRDYVHFVLGERVLWPAAAPDAARSPAET